MAWPALGQRFPNWSNQLSGTGQGTFEAVPWATFSINTVSSTLKTGLLFCWYTQQRPELGAGAELLGAPDAQPAPTPSRADYLYALSDMGVRSRWRYATRATGTGVAWAFIRAANDLGRTRKRKTTNGLSGDLSLRSVAAGRTPDAWLLGAAEAAAALALLSLSLDHGVPATVLSCVLLSAALSVATLTWLARVQAGVAADQIGSVTGLFRGVGDLSSVAAYTAFGVISAHLALSLRVLAAVAAAAGCGALSLRESGERARRGAAPVAR